MTPAAIQKGVWWRRGLAAQSLLCLLGCTAGGPAPADSPATPQAGAQDPLLDPGELGPDFVWRQRLKTSYGEESFRFEAVLEKSQTSLRVLLLTPYGTRALLIEQVESDVRTRYFIPQRLPFPPRHILGDIQRVYFRGFSSRRPSDGTQTQELQGELFHDTWDGGTLLERRIQKAPDSSRSPARRPEPATISIRYTPGFRPGSPPPRVRLKNDWYGYQIEIETLPSP